MSKSSNDGTDANEPTYKSYCAGVGCVTANLIQVITMCVKPIRVKHSDSDKEVEAFALLDTCSQGTFVTEDEDFSQHQTLNGNQKQWSS